jgi:hypothetical protein
MQLRDVFDDRQAEASAAEVAASPFISAIKSFKNPREIFGPDSNSLIAHA